MTRPSTSPVALALLGAVVFLVGCAAPASEGPAHTDDAGLAAVVLRVDGMT